MRRIKKYKLSKQRQKEYNLMVKQINDTAKSTRHLAPHERHKTLIPLLETVYRKYGDLELWCRKLQDTEKEHKRQGEISNSVMAGVLSGMLSGLIMSLIECCPFLDNFPVFSFIFTALFCVIIGIVLALLSLITIKHFVVSLPSPLLDAEVELLKCLIHEKDPSIPLSHE